MAAVALPYLEGDWPRRRPVPARRLERPRRPGGGSPRLAPPPVRRPVSARVRHRRRLVVLMTLVLALGAVWALEGGVGWLGGGPLTAPGPDPASALPAAAVVHLVEPGDTVWSIARQYQPRGEIRPLVDRLVAQEHGRPLQVGERLVLR